MRKRISYFVPDRDWEELLVPVLKEALADEGVVIETQQEQEPPLVGYVGIYAVHDNPSVLEEACAVVSGMMTLLSVLSHNELVTAEEARPLRERVKSNIEHVL